MAKSKKAKKKKKAQKPLGFRRIAKWFVVLCVWGFIATGLLVAWYASDLPRLIETPQFERRNAMTILDHDGTMLARYGDVKGLNVSVETLPPHLIYAVLATEDRRFYQHHGVDPVGIARAFVTNIRAGKLVQGGSTITQQLAKNLFLSRERTFKRKIQEAILAIWLEYNLSKDEILSAYLNRVYLGAGAYGVDAASHIYFDKPAQDVSLREAATLAGLLKAPSRYSPHSNPGLAAQRAKTVLAAMHDAGYISAQDADRQSLTTPIPKKKPTESGAIRYFTDWVISNLDELIGTPGDDLTIETTLDPIIQSAAEQSLSRILRQFGEDRQVSQGAVIVLAPDGAVLAMVGGRNYGSSQFNRATQSMRPPGSSFKPVVFLTALQQGWDGNALIEDAPITEGEYQPKNFKDEYFGTVTLEDALTYSMNTAAVRLAQDVGIGNVLTTARRLGIRTRLPRDLSMTLGSGGVPMLEMVSAYTVFANGGYSINPYTITRITDKDNRIIYQHTSLRPAKPLFEKSALLDLNDMLQEVVEDGTGRGAALTSSGAAGKTGTSQDFRDAWFIGYTDCCIGAVWLGNDDNSPMNRVTGGSLPATIWRDVMIAANSKKKGPKSLFPVSSAAADSGFSTLLQRLFSF